MIIWESFETHCQKYSFACFFAKFYADKRKRHVIEVNIAYKHLQAKRFSFHELGNLGL